MARKRKSATQEPPADISSNTTTTAVAEPPPGIPDQVAATTENRPNFAERVGPKKENILPDPFGIAGDYQAGVRLFESRRDHQMALKFDEKPSQAVIDKLKEAGYRWNPKDMIWAQPVWPVTAMSTRIKAERLYQEVCQMIRDDKNIESSQEVPF